LRILSTGTLIAFSTTCAPSVPASARLRAIQVQLTPVVAATSGAAITGAVDSAIADAFAPAGSAPVFGAPGMMRVNLLPEDEQRGRIPEAFEALNYVDRPGGRLPTRPERDWSVWIDGRGTRWVRDDNTNEVRSTQLNVTAGISRKLTPDALIGLIAGYENFRYDVPGLDGNLKGNGWTVGLYGAWRLAPQVRIDGTVAWSNVNYDGTAGASNGGVINGTSTGAFTGNRWLASVGVTGVYQSSGVILEPSARVYVLGESQAAWVDSVGLEQAARQFYIGRASVGGKLSYPLPATADLSITPYAGIYSDYRFSKDDAEPVDIANLGIKDGLSGRVVSGFTVTNKLGATLTLSGELGGLGWTDQRLWSASARGVMPF
jgi:hypothetical protein